MSDVLLTIPEIDRRIAAIRENLRELIEQAAAFSGAADEERLVSELESTREAVRNDPPAATLIVELLATEKQNLMKLRELTTTHSTKVPA